MGGSSVKYTQHNAAQKKVDQLINAHTHTLRQYKLHVVMDNGYTRSQ